MPASEEASGDTGNRTTGPARFTGAVPAASAAGTASPPHDRDELRSVLGRFATGITVVTGIGPLGPHGMTANSFTSVSLSPPLVLICVMRNAAMHQAILDYQAFGICMLSTAQEPVAKYFANRGRPHGEHEFDLVDWRPGRHTGVPLVNQTLAWIECGLSAVHDGGDHSIFVGSVLDLGRSTDDDALLYFGGTYRRLESGLAAEGRPDQA